MPADGQQMSVEVAPEELTPESDEPVNGLQIQALRNVDGSIPEGPVGQSGGEAAGRAQSRNDSRRAIVRQCQRRGLEGGPRSALNGNSAVLRLIVTRLIGPRRHRASGFAMPLLQGAADVAPAIAAIAAAAAEGAISTAEASEMSQVVERYTRALAADEIEARLRRLESAYGLAR
jgi:hypothetical protein